MGGLPFRGKEQRARIKRTLHHQEVKKHTTQGGRKMNTVVHTTNMHPVFKNMMVPIYEEKHHLSVAHLCQLVGYGKVNKLLIQGNYCMITY